MKRKIILLVLIIVLGILAWRLFVKTFSTGPIEIVVENKTNQNLEHTSEHTSKQNQEKTLDNTTERSVETTTEDSIEVSTEKSATIEKTKTDFISLTEKKVSWGYSPFSGRTIDTIVLHSSYDALGAKPYSVDGLIAEYKQYGVAPHFLIDREGKIYRLVDEENIAYHAGVSKTPDGRSNVNNFSVGIELMNTKEDNYTNNQYSSLNYLIDYLESQFPIKYVLGHNKIAPDRKTDPWNFDWTKVESKKSIQ